MANFTKKAILESFLKLLNDRPLNKITVKDITDDCGINRNTFYYHYQDIPTLIQEVFSDEITRIIHEYPNIDSIEQCLIIGIGFALENRRAILHIYNSVNRDIFEQYLWQVCEQTVKIYFNTVFPGTQIAEDVRAVLLETYSCITFGLISNWLRDGMRGDVVGFMRQTCELHHGVIHEIVSRAALYP